MKRAVVVLWDISDSEEMETYPLEREEAADSKASFQEAMDGLATLMNVKHAGVSALRRGVLQTCFLIPQELVGTFQNFINSFTSWEIG